MTASRGSPVVTSPGLTCYPRGMLLLLLACAGPAVSATEPVTVVCASWDASASPAGVEKAVRAAVKLAAEG